MPTKPHKNTGKSHQINADRQRRIARSRELEREQAKRELEMLEHTSLKDLIR